MKGLIFDIKGFSVNDGEGIRTTVFLKGCPLRCVWCHNPEGLNPKKELYVKKVGCKNCGKCFEPCGHADCKPFGRCLHVCPGGLVRVAGEEWDSAALAEHLLRGADIFGMSGGGITLSGGEPLLQHGFAVDLLKKIGKEGINRAVETSGYAEPEVFCEVISHADFVYMDLKIADPEKHRTYTGASNEKILENAGLLQNSGVRHIFRIPLIPGLTDGAENLAALAAVAGESQVELLPYNRLAPAKYASVGRRYPDYIKAGENKVCDLKIFKNAVLKK